MIDYKTATDKIREVKTIAQKHREETLNDQPVLQDVSSSYAGGNPTFVPLEGGTATSDEKRILMSVGSASLKPDDRALVVPTGRDFSVVGVLRDLPSGLLYIGEYVLIPFFALTETAIGIGTADQVRIWKVGIPQEREVNSVHFRITTGAASSFVSFALYSSETSNQSKVIDIGAIDSSSTGAVNHTLASTAYLAPGSYWAAWTASDNAVRLSGVQMATNLASIFNAGTLQLGRATNGASAGVMPSDLDAPVDVSLREFPMFKLQR